MDPITIRTRPPPLIRIICPYKKQQVLNILDLKILVSIHPLRGYTPAKVQCQPHREIETKRRQRKMSCNMTSPLCGSCKAVTFTMLLDGFVHPKRFTDAIVSGRTCKLCRLMVCMYSKLQIKSPWSPYEVEKSYDTISDSLASLPAVSRELVGIEDLPYFETLEKPVDCLSWKRGEYQMDFKVRPKPILRYGNFGDGSTIQVSACEGEFLSLRLKYF
jgi:hypothetical protein